MANKTISIKFEVDASELAQFSKCQKIIDDFQKSMNNIGRNKNNSGIGDEFKKASKEAENASKSFDKLNKTQETSNRTFKSGEQHTAKYSQKVKDASGKIKEYTVMTTKADGSLEKLVRGTNGAVRTETQYKEAMKGVTEATKQNVQHSGKLHESMKGLNKYQLSFADATRIATERMFQWATASNLIYGVNRTLKALVDTTIQLDSQMVDLQKVMSDTQAVEAFESAKQAANDYAKTLTEVMDAYNSFGQMGYQGADLESMSRASALMSNVSELDMTQSAEALIATVNAFGVAATDAERIVDMFNETQNNFAISTQDLSDSFTRAGATANTFGVGITELIGHTTAIKEVTRSSGAEIGNALKTIYSRITTMNPAIEAVGSVGVKVFDEQTGAVRSVSTILDELGSKWSGLSDNQKQYIAVQVAGRNQLSKFIALMDNYGTATDSATASIESFGSAAEENKKQTESLEGQLNKLKSSLQILADDVGKGGFGSAFGTSIKVASTAIKGLDGMIKDLGSGWTIALSGSMVGIAGIVKESQSVFKMITNGSEEAKDAMSNFGQTTLGQLLSMNGATEKTQQIFASLSSVIGNVTKSIGGMITAALQNPFTWVAVAIAGLTYLKGKTEEQKEEMKNLKDATKSANEEFDEFNDKIANSSIDSFDIETFTGKLKQGQEALKETQKVLDDYINKTIEVGTTDTLSALNMKSGSAYQQTQKQIEDQTKRITELNKKHREELEKNTKAVDVLNYEQQEQLATLGLTIDENTTMEEVLARGEFRVAKMAESVDRAKQSMIEQTEQALYPQAVAYENLEDAITNTTSSLESHAEIIAGISNDTVSNLEQSANAYIYLLEKQKSGAELTTLQQEEMINVQNALCSSLGISNDTLSENIAIVEAAAEAKADYNSALETWLQDSSEENRALLDEAEARMNATQKQLEQTEATNREAEARKMLAEAGVEEENMSAKSYESAMNIRMESIRLLKQTHGEAWDTMQAKEKEALAVIQDNEVAIQNYANQYTGAEKIRAEMSARKLADLEGEKTAHSNVAQSIQESSEKTKTAISQEAEISKASSESIKQDNEAIAQSESDKATAVSEASTNYTTSMSNMTTASSENAEKIKSANESITGSFSKLSSDIKSNADSVNHATDLLVDAFEGLSKTGSSEMSNLRSLIGDKCDRIIGHMKSMTKNGIEVAQKAMKDFASSASSNATTIKDAINGIEVNTRGGLDNLSDNIEDVEDAWNDLKNSMDGKTIEGKIKIGFSFGGDGVDSDGGGGVLNWSKVQSEAMSKLGGTSISGQGYGSLRLTSPYGRRIDPINGRMGAFHDGIDLAGPMGTPVRARRGGTVVYAGWRGGYGNYVRIASGNGLETFYGHMSSINVRTGQSVPAGTLIGAIGSTGRSTGPHLHFGAAMNGSSINPTPFYHQGGIVQKAPRQNEVDTRLQVGEMVLTQKQQKSMFDILNSSTTNRNGRGINEGGRYNNPFTGIGGELYLGKGGSVFDNQETAKNYVQLTEQSISNKEKWFGGYYSTPLAKWNSILFARSAYANGSRNEYNTQMLEALSEMDDVIKAYERFNKSGFFFSNKKDWSNAWNNISKSITENYINKMKGHAETFTEIVKKQIKEASEEVNKFIDVLDGALSDRKEEKRNTFVDAYIDKLLEAQELSFAMISEEEKLENKMKDIQDKINSRAEESANLEYYLSTGEPQARLNELLGYMSQLGNEIKYVQAEMSRNWMSQESIDKALEPLRNQLAEVDEEYYALLKTINDSNDQIKTNKSEIEDLANEYKNLEKELSNIANKRDFTDIWGNVVYSTDGAVTQITENGQLIMNTLANVKNAIAGIANDANVSNIIKELDSMIKNVPSTQLSVTSSTTTTNVSKADKETYQADTNVIRNVTYVVQTGVALASESELREFAMILKEMIDEENSRG